MSSPSKEPEANRDDIDDDEAARQRASRARMLAFVRLADLARNRGFMPSPPPLEMFTHPDLLEKAWGWDRLLPFDYIDKHGCCTPLYMRYLHQYYRRNCDLSITKHCVGDLDSCAKMEAKLLSAGPASRFEVVC
ncbi:hypothetical protein BS78_01G440600 [Paspalum vaginatum]|nr:hypothetical protein BS78_01G440600 [Paspalum vaginatum]